MTKTKDLSALDQQKRRISDALTMNRYAIGWSRKEGKPGEWDWHHGYEEGIVDILDFMGIPYAFDDRGIARVGGVRSRFAYDPNGKLFDLEDPTGEKHEKSGYMRDLQPEYLWKKGR